MTKYVERGGKLVIGCRTGYKDENGRCVMTAKPGLLSRLCGAEVLATYTSNYYKEKPALVRNRYGKGETYYFGGTFSQAAADVFLKKLEVYSPWSEIVTLPSECEIAVRQKENDAYLFILNYAHHPVEINLKITCGYFRGRRFFGNCDNSALWCEGIPYISIVS